jgi:hypothetical protein
MKPGRNDPCPCGSGKKYKKCCYLTGQTTALKNFMESQDIQDDEAEDFYVEDDYDEDHLNKQEALFTVMNNLHRLLLGRKPHIKKYHKIRKLHGEIINAMIQYHYDGKFEKQIDTNVISKTEPEEPLEIHLLESSFDLETREGIQAFFDIWIYKTASNVNCITDDFIRNHRYRKPEKIEFLHSMLDSKLGLFEVTGTDMKEGYAYIKDVFTGAECTIVDIGLSGNPNYDEIYIYTRIISYQGINFGTGLNLVFEKNNNFIKNHIKQQKKNFDPNGEFLRFTQLYNRYSQDSGGIRVIAT